MPRLDVDSLDESRKVMTLITLHQAKGLEFPVVFMIGMEDGVLPHFKSFSDPAQMEEERRLCYVGMTRAKERLYLFRATRRMLMGGSNANPPSTFLDDVPYHLVKSIGPEGTTLAKPSRSLGAHDGFFPDEPASSFDGAVLAEGQHVYHAAFGEGVVISCNPTRGDFEVVVAFEGAGEKRLLASMAMLERRG